MSDRAITAIQVLNLGDSPKKNRALIEKRKRVFDFLLWKNSVDPTKGLEDEEILKGLIVELAKPQQGQLESFSPIVINILRSWLQV